MDNDSTLTWNKLMKKFNKLLKLLLKFFPISKKIILNLCR